LKSRETDDQQQGHDDAAMRPDFDHVIASSSMAQAGETDAERGEISKPIEKNAYHATIA
jgi:hypothetical protein